MNHVDAIKTLFAIVEADAPRNRAVLVSLVGEEETRRIEREIDAGHAREREACPIRARLAAVEQLLAARRAK
jgi:hypothetical protein